MENNRYALVGKNISYSLSPDIHKKIYECLGINCEYELLDVENISIIKILKKIRKDYRGVNITIPYKKILLEHMDILGEEAEKIGAINTICVYNGKLIGRNTDYFGFKNTIEILNIDVKDKDAVIMGTGGVAFAVMTYLLDKNIKNITVLTRDSIDSLKKVFKNKYFNDNRNKINILDYNNYGENYVNDRNIIINATPVGMTGYESKLLVSREELKKFDILIDLIYSPKETLILNEYKKLNKNGIAVNGLNMLVRQAVYTEEIWQKSKIDSSVIENIKKMLSI